MRSTVLAFVALATSGVHFAEAQATQAAPCASAPVPAQDACYAAVDLFLYMTPQLGISLTGGNVILSQGGTNGGLPRITVGARANVINGNLPDLQTPRETGPAFWVASNPYPTKNQYLGLPVVDVSIGLFRGFRVGAFTIGGVDALGSATMIPTLTSSGAAGEISIEPDNPLKIGYGGRIGLIEEERLTPGVAVNFMLRDLPVTTLLATIGADSLQVTDFTLKTTSWRLTAGKSFTGLVLAAGVGQDIYDTSTGLEAIVNRPAPIGRVTTGAVTADHKVTRMNVFGNVALNFLVAKIVAEAGLVTGGDIATSNVFDVAASAARTYASLGVRIGY